MREWSHRPDNAARAGQLSQGVRAVVATATSQSFEWVERDEAALAVVSGVEVDCMGGYSPEWR